MREGGRDGQIASWMNRVGVKEERGEERAYVSGREGGREAGWMCSPLLRTFIYIQNQECKLFIQKGLR